MRPLIGITMNLDEEASRSVNMLDQDYGRAIAEAGGIPVPILGIDAALPDLVQRLDGFLFTGGDDIHPRFYRELPRADAKLRLASDRRVRFELDLFKAASRSKKPILAICYGAQLVNVALGGSLYQDIGQQIPRTLKHGPSRSGEHVLHPVSVFEGTRLFRILGNRAPKGDRIISVRSAHHQSIKNPGRGLRLAAVSSDGPGG